MRLSLRLALGLALLMPASGHAQDLTAASAQSLQDQMHAWLASLLGPGGNPASLTPTVTAADDHYQLTLAIPGLVGDDTASARLRPLDGGRWALDAIQLPASMQFNAHLPDTGGSPGGATAFSLTLGSQQSHALVDPALNSRSELDIDLHNLLLRSDGPHAHQEQRIGEYRVSASLQPAQAGTLDFDQSATITGWSSLSQLEGKPAVTFGADRLSMSGRIAGLDRDQAGVLLTAASGLLATLPAKAAAQGAAAPLSPEERAALHQLVLGLRGIFTSVHGEETIDGLHVALAGMGEATINHVRFGVGGDAPHGLLHAWLDVTLDGLTVANLPPQAAGLVPHHVVLRPSLGGIPADALMKLALEATEPNANQAQVEAEAESLLTTGGATLGLEKLGFDVGPADVQGTGHVTVTGPMQYRGEAHLTATGLDALIDRAHGDPMLQRAIPMLIMLRGFAKPEGDHLVWNVLANDGEVTVNGIELVKPHGPGSGHDGEPHPPSR